MRVIPVPCLSDNYAYLVTADGKSAVVVDPSEAEPVAAALAREGLELKAILCTHHHPDHVGGNEGLLERFGKMPVFAHESDEGRVPAQTDLVKEGVPVEVAGLSFTPFHVPGHTTGAVAYYGHGAVFTGDTLFVAGCGRLFEGTPAMMYTSLCEKLAKLPADTKVYCGHEYTASNLKFALHAEPDNAAAKAKAERVAEMRGRGEFTVPSTMGEELQTNPFLRVHEAGLRERFPGETPADVLGAVRKAKDTFKG
ncbi:MAG: hydroxyacylglutathione hydrolase [Polyangiaceae bacterium]